MAERDTSKQSAEPLAPPASQELERCVARYRSDMMAEAARLEAASSNPEVANPEITSTMVRDADLLLRRGYRRPKPPGWVASAKLGSVVGGFFTGLLADFDKLVDPRWLLAFIVIMAVTIGLTVAVTLKE